MYVSEDNSVATFVLLTFHTLTPARLDASAIVLDHSHSVDKGMIHVS